MVKMLDLVDTTKNLACAANGLFFDGTTYYAVFLDSVTIRLKYTTDFITWTELANNTAAGGSFVSANACWFKDGTTVYVAASVVTDDIVANYARILGEINTGTLAFTARTLVFSHAMGIFKIGADIWSMLPSAGGDFWKWNTITYATDAGFFMQGAGYGDGTYYYFLSHDVDPPAAGHFNIRKFDGAAFTAVSTNAVGSAATIAPTLMISRLFKQGNYEYIIADGAVLFKSTAFDWTYFDISDRSQFGFYWNSTTLTIRYIYCNAHIYEILPSGQPITLKINISLIPQGSWDAYVADYTTANLYQFTPTTTTIFRTCIVNDVLMRMPAEIKLEMNIRPITDQYLKLYNDAGALRFQGRCLTYRDDTSIFNVTIQSPTVEDLDQPIDYDPAGTTAATIIADLLDTYCSWITYDGTSLSTTPTHLYYKRWTSTSLFKILNEIAKTEGYWWSIDPNFILHFQRGVASGVTITDASDGVFFPRPLPVEKLPLPKSYYYLEGRWDVATNARLYVTDYTDANAALYYDQFPNADAAELSQKLVGLKSLLNQELIYARFGCYNKVLNVGESFDLTLTKWSITADTYYVQEIQEDLVANTISVVTVSAISIPKQTPEQQTEARITCVEENLDELNERIGDTLGASVTYWFGNATLVTSLTDSSTALTESTDADPDTLSTITFKSAVGDTTTPVTIEAGTIIVIHFPAKVTATAGKKTVQLYCIFGYVDADGTSNFTQIGTNSDSTADLTATQTDYELHVHVSAQTTVPSGKRYWLKFVADTAGAGNEPEINVYYNDHFSHITIPTSAAIIGNLQNQITAAETAAAAVKKDLPRFLGRTYYSGSAYGAPGSGPHGMMGDALISSSTDWVGMNFQVQSCVEFTAYVWFAWYADDADATHTMNCSWWAHADGETLTDGGTAVPAMSCPAGNHEVIRLMSIKQFTSSDLSVGDILSFKFSKANAWHQHGMIYGMRFLAT